jgi:hypothetical protein
LEHFLLLQKLHHHLLHLDYHKDLQMLFHHYFLEMDLLAEYYPFQ